MDAKDWELATASSEGPVDASLVALAAPFDRLPATDFLPARSLSSTQATVLAQQFDQDILGDLSNAWNTFIESGQVWALIIGIVLGYLIRGLTAY